MRHLQSRCPLARFAALAVLFLLAVSSFRAEERADDLKAKAKACLAKIDGELSVPGLAGPVEVLRDRWGVPHIYARSEDDLFFAQGFVAAQDRLFQIDMWRRVGSGETAEIIGPSGLERDRFARLLKYRGEVDAEWASYGPKTRRIAAAFSRGVNACIDEFGDRPPIEYQLLGIRPKKWRPEDCLGRMSGIIMTRDFRFEIPRAALVAAVGIDKARRLAPANPAIPYAPARGLDLAGVDLAVLAGYNRATSPLPFEKEGGSNNWVIDGKLSASGKPMLASDPHRTVHLPSLRYLVHLNAPGWNVIGAGEPGLPGVAIGHNDKVAWGFTIVCTDQADFYLEETAADDPTRYRVGDRWEPMKIVREQVRVRGKKEPVEVELRFTRHGPVLFQDAKRRRAFALRWIGSEPGTAAYLGCLAVDQARSGADFVKALRAWKLPCENMVYADVVGNIGWVAAAQTPIRKGWHGLLPVPGAAGDFEWQGYLKLDQLPQVHNPASHFAATANSNILPKGYKHEIAYEWAAPYRYERVRQRLLEKKKFDLADFKSIQLDNTSLPGQRLALLAKRLEGRDVDQKLVKLMSAWDGDLSRETPAGPLYTYWRIEVQRELFRPFVPEPLLDFVAEKNALPVALKALEEPDEFWFGAEPVKARDRLLERTFKSAAARTKQRLGNDPSKWSWGKMHRAEFVHPLAGLGQPIAQAFNLPSVPRPGDGYTPNATSYNKDFVQTSGATYRHVFDLADWDRGLVTSAPGQSGQPGSPHYGDLLPLWAKGEYFPLAFSRKKVEEVTRNRLRLTPRK